MLSIVEDLLIKYLSGIADAELQVLIKKLSGNPLFAKIVVFVNAAAAELAQSNIDASTEEPAVPSEPVPPAS